MAHGLRGLVLFDSARLAPRRGGPSSPSSCPPWPPPTWLRACGHRLPALLDGGRHQPGVQVVKQAWARGCACLVLGCTDVKLYSKQDLSHPEPCLSPHTTLLSSVWSEALTGPDTSPIPSQLGPLLLVLGYYWGGQGLMASLA